jgi:hypothetical protein
MCADSCDQPVAVGAGRYSRVAFLCTHSLHVAEGGPHPCCRRLTALSCVSAPCCVCCCLQLLLRSPFKLVFKHTNSNSLQVVTADMVGYVLASDVSAVLLISNAQLGDFELWHKLREQHLLAAAAAGQSKRRNAAGGSGSKDSSSGGSRSRKGRGRVGGGGGGGQQAWKSSLMKSSSLSMPSGPPVQPRHKFGVAARVQQCFSEPGVSLLLLLLCECEWVCVMCCQQNHMSLLNSLSAVKQSFFATQCLLVLAPCTFVFARLNCTVVVPAAPSAAADQFPGWCCTWRRYVRPHDLWSILNTPRG